MSNFLLLDIGMYSQIFSSSILVLQYDHIHKCKYAFNITIQIFDSVLPCQETSNNFQKDILYFT